MNNATQELNLTELDRVSGGSALEVFTYVVEIYQFMKENHGLSDAINYIKQQAGK